MRRIISDGQASESTVCHDTPQVLKVREGALRFALCDRLHVPSNEHTTMTHAARQLTGQRERSPDSDLSPVRKGEEQDWGARKSGGCGRYGGAGSARVGGKPVAPQQSEVAEHGREGRLPRISLRRLPERGRATEATGAATWRVSWPERETLKRKPEFCKTCLPGSTSVMHLKTEEKKRGTLGRPDLGSHS